MLEFRQTVEFLKIYFNGNCFCISDNNTIMFNGQVP